MNDQPTIYDDPNVQLLLEYEHDTDNESFKNPKEIKADNIKCRNIYRKFKDNYYTKEDMKTLKPLIEDYSKLVDHEIFNKFTREGGYYVDRRYR